MSERDVSELSLKIQALIDNELPAEEIDPVLEQIQGSYEHREEFAELLRLRRRLAGAGAPEPPSDWVTEVQRRLRRRVFNGAGVIAFLGSYVGLAAYAIVTVLRRNSFPSLVIVALAVGVLGFLSLLGLTIADRVRESRNDKYRSVIR